MSTLLKGVEGVWTPLSYLESQTVINVSLPRLRVGLLCESHKP